MDKTTLTGLVFTQRGSKKEENRKEEDGESQIVNYTSKETLILNYLQIPINAKFYHPINDDIKVFGFAGPYIAFGLSGKHKIENTWTGAGYDEFRKVERNVFSDEYYDKNGMSRDVLNRSDFGLNFGGGILQNAIVFLMERIPTACWSGIVGNHFRKPPQTL